MDRVRFIVRLGLALVATWIVLSLGAPTVPHIVRAQPPRVDVLIGFANPPGPAEQALVRGQGGNVTRSFRLVRAIAASLPGPAVTALLNTPSVTAIELDGTLILSDAELDNTWSVKRIGAGTVHAAGNRGASVKVAVIDSGIDYTHPELGANYAGGYDFVNDDSDPMDDNGHGTHVVGTIAALDNGTGVVGTAPLVSLYALKAFDAAGSGSFSDVIAALEWAVDHGVQVTNNSYGDTRNPGSIVEAAFANAEAAGVLHVAAAGNTGTFNGKGNTVNYPARYGSLVAVGATDFSDVRAFFSSTGPTVEIAAPGFLVYSTLPNGAYGWLYGTSMASPHVAGTAALLISGGIGDTNGNGRITDEIRATLTSTSQDLGQPGRDHLYGFGLVDAAAAVASVGPSGPAVIVGLTTDKLTYANPTDTSAVLAAAVTDEEGTPISKLAAGAFVTILDGSAPVFATPFIETATAGTYTASIDISTVAEGAHSVEVTATDSRGLSGVGTAAFDVAPPDPADLIVSSASAPSAAAAGASIDVTDTTTNQGAGAADTSTTTFYLSVGVLVDPTDVVLGSRTVPALGSGAGDTATTTLVIPSGTAGGRYRVIVRANADGTVTESNTFNNNAWVTLDVGPDLRVTAFDVPGGGAPGGTITVTDTTQNEGVGEAAESTTQYYLSTNALLDGGDELIGSRSVGVLASQGVSTGSASVQIPPATTPGSYYLLATADGGDVVAEAVETNNTWFASFTVGADLVVSTISAPTTAGAGATITVSDTTANIGSATAGASITQVYLSDNFLLDAGDTLLGGRSVPSLNAGANNAGSTDVTIPTQTPSGSYYLLAVADGTDQVAETAETNNNRFRTIQIGADLVVSSLDAPSGAGAGETIAVTDTTANQGTSDASNSVTRFYLSSDFIVDASDTVLGERVVSSLAVGASETQTTNVTIPSATPAGSYQIIAVADANEEVVETSEGNNTRFRMIQTGSDLVVSAFSGPTTAGSGQSIVVSDTTINQGSGQADASTTRFYLSDNFGLDVQDVDLGSRPVPALGPGASDSATSALTIPAGTVSGSYYLLAQADGAGTVPETSEANNVTFWNIQIGADLVISALSAPSSAGAGVTITINDTTKNQGTSPGGVSTTRYFLSTNIGVDAGDAVLGQRAVGALDPGATDTGSVTVTIPTGIASGWYFLLALADADDAVVETSNWNNTKFGTIAIGPDLSVSAVSARWTARAGTSIAVTDTTVNVGGAPVGASTTGIYFSGNVFLDPGDVLLGSRAIPALAAGASDQGTTQVTIPAGLSPGYYYLIGQADTQGAVQEVQETNNLRLGLIRVLAGS